MRSSVLLLALALCSCGRFGALYPPRPAEGPGAPDADPAPSRLVAHVSVTSEGLRAALESGVPVKGDGSFLLLGASRPFSWTRRPVGLSFRSGRLVLAVHVDASISLPIETVALPLDLEVATEPVVSRDYAVKLQSVDVKVSSTDRRLAVANALAGVYDSLGREIKSKIEAFSYDLRPFIDQAYSRVARPLRFPVGDAEGCARVKVLDVEAGPTIVADGIDKDLALVIAPSVTLPCGADEPAPPLPPLANVASLPSGPFTVTVPVAASYEEIAKAMSAAFTDGKLFFSKDYPELYFERPELYESQGVIVLKLHLNGPVHAMGIEANLDGDVFFSGHIQVVDNEIAIPDLEPTIETSNFFLSLKAATGSSAIRDQARAALRVDLGARLKQVKTSLADDLTFGGKDACFHGDVDKLEVTGVHPHGNYLRVYLAVTGRASASMPCAVSGVAVTR